MTCLAHVDGSNLSKVSSSCRGSAPTPTKASDYSVYDSFQLVEGSLFFLLGSASAPLPFWPSCMFSTSSPTRFGFVSSLGPVQLQPVDEFFRWSSLISSPIFSFNALHSSIKWPRLQWHRQCFEWFAFGGVLTLLGMVKMLTAKA